MMQQNPVTLITAMLQLHDIVKTKVNVAIHMNIRVSPQISLSVLKNIAD